MHRGRLRAQKLAEVLVFFAPRSFHEVRSERERCAAESDERDLRRQLGANDAQGVANVGSDRLAQRQSFDGFARPQRVHDRRTRVELDLDAERLERRHDVAEDDGRVERKTAQRLQRDLRGDLGRARHLQERRALFNREILGEIASGLAHDPNGSPIPRDAAHRLQKAHREPFPAWKIARFVCAIHRGAARIGPSLMPSALCWTPRRRRPCRDLTEAGASFPP